MLGKLSDTASDKTTQSETLSRRPSPKMGQFAAVRTEHDELRSAMRVFEAVVGELSERIEILETRATVREAADAVAVKSLL